MHHYLRQARTQLRGFQSGEKVRVWVFIIEQFRRRQFVAAFSHDHPDRIKIRVNRVHMCSTCVSKSRFHPFHVIQLSLTTEMCAFLLNILNEPAFESFSRLHEAHRRGVTLNILRSEDASGQI
jgi:hypothetical protein